ncbi:hypothetical protein GF343_06210 [Candidatus Woesearchaeota archaeon]|nr:hypothetical protein [Candidatus Woesearchaeota archaeon]
MDEGIGKKCYQCPECSGSGLNAAVEIAIDGKEDIEYLPCEYCSGMQCYQVKNDDFHEGECDRSCGFHRETLKKDWLKM